MTGELLITDEERAVVVRIMNRVAVLGQGFTFWTPAGPVVFDRAQRKSAMDRIAESLEHIERNTFQLLANSERK